MAALVDALGNLRVREVGPTFLPQVNIFGSFTPSLQYLADRTATKVSTIKRDYHRSNCSDHCPTPHTHIVSTAGRWEIIGVKATIVLYGLAPYMQVQQDKARELVRAGRTIGYKGQVVNRMAELGWKIPDLKPQPRARVEVPR
jgi:hypothetical protein